MKIPIKIESVEGSMLAFSIFEGSKSISSGVTTDTPGGFKITLEKIIEHRAFDVPSVLQFVVDTAITIDTGLFCAWLYEKVKEPTKTKIFIREREIKFEEGEIKKALEREINIEK